jgi:hypothetical protein
MPGFLQQGARCPKCGGDIDAIVRTENAKSLTAEYFHAKGITEGRRKRRCKITWAQPVAPSARAYANYGDLSAGAES